MEKEKLIALVKKAQTGDPQAMEYLLRFAHTSVSYQCRKFMKNEQDAEDMTQEVLLVIYQKLDRLVDPGAFLSWANRIAATRCITALERTHVEYQIAEDEEGHSLLDGIEELDKQKIPDAALDNAETARMIEALIDGLPDAQRVCTYLFYYDQMSVKEIAGMLDVSENTVKSRLNYARKSIKDGVLDYEKKEGIKLYGFSPLPFLLYFLRRAAAASADPAAAKAVAQSITATGTASAATATSTASKAAAPPRKPTGKYAKSGKKPGKVSAAGKSAAGKAAAGKAAGAVGSVTVKVAAGIVAAAVAVGGVAVVVTNTVLQRDDSEQASTQGYAATENVVAVQAGAETETPVETTVPPEPTAETLPEEPYTILRTAIDPQGYDVEMYLETPYFAVISEGYRNINAFFENMRDEYLNGGDESVSFMFERLAQKTDDIPYCYMQACTVRCQDERLVSVSINSTWYAGGPNYSYTYSNYTFDASTGELLELKDLIDGTEEEITELVYYAITAELGEFGDTWSAVPSDYDSLLFYVEDNQIWVRPGNSGYYFFAIPYVALPVEINFSGKTYTTVRTEIDTQGYDDVEIYLETPQFVETSEGYRKINEFFENMRYEFQYEDEKISVLFDSLEKRMYDLFYCYTRTFEVKCQNEYFVSVTFLGDWCSSPVGTVLRENYTFDAQTGELLELTDLINGSKEEIAELMYGTFAEEYGGEFWFYAPDTYDSYRFYIEDNRIWVRPEGERVTSLLPYLALPVELQ